MSGYRPGMLDDLEDGPGIGLSAPTVLTPPANVAEPNSSAPAKPGRTRVQPSTEVGSAPTPRKRRGRPPIPPDGRPQTRPTNVLIPVSVFDRVARAREELAMSTGEIIAIAIEAELKQLPSLLGVPKGSLFETRASRLPHRIEEPERPLSFRLTGADLATIDSLVEKYGARSRGHLIAVALNAHFTN